MIEGLSGGGLRSYAQVLERAEKYFKQGVDKRQKNANFYYNATRDELALLTRQHELQTKHPSVVCQTVCS